MKWIRWGLGLFAAFALLLGAVLWWGFGTEAGARFALARAVAESGGKLSFTGASGSIAGPLELRGAVWRDPAAGVEVRIASARVDIDVAPLLGGRVRLRVLDVSGVDVLLTTTAADGEPLDLRAPLDFEFDGLTIERARIVRDGELVLDADRVELAGRWTSTELALDKLALRAAQGRVDVEGSVGLTGGYPGKATAKFDWRDGERRYAGGLQARSDGRLAHVSTALTLPVPATVDANIGLGGKNAWTLALSVPEFDATALDPAATPRKLSAVLRGRGEGMQGTLTGELGIDAYKVQVEPLRFARNDSVLRIEQLVLRSADIPGTVQLSGDIATAADPVTATLAIEWQDLLLPAELAGQELASNGRVDFSGALAAYDIEGAFALGPPGKLADFSVSLHGTPALIELKRLALTQANGSVEASGELEPGPPFAWRISARARRFDPSVLWPDWPGALDFTLASEGSRSDETLQAHLDLDGLSGTLRGRNVAGEADIRIAPGGALDGTLALRSGKSTLSLRGSGGASTDAVLAIDSASLGDWLPALGGSLRGEFTLRGAWPALAVTGRAQGKSLSYEAYRIATLTLDVELGSIEPLQGHSAMAATGVDAGSLHFDTLTLELDGTREKHTFALSGQGEELGVEARLSGGGSTEGWAGTLDTLVLAPRDVERFVLGAPATLSWGETGFTLGESCLSGDGSRVCASVDRNADGSALATYRVERVPLALIRAIAAADAPLRADGVLDGSGTLARDAEGRWSGTANLGSAAGSVAYPDDAESPLLEYTGLRVDAQLTPEATRIVANAALGAGGRFDGTLAIDARRNLSGEVSLSVDELAFVELLTSELASVRGRADARYSIAGTLDAPQLRGSLDLSGFSAEVPTAGIKLSDGKVAIAAAGNDRFEISGQVSSSKGILHLSGSGGLGDDAPLRVELRGERVLVANIPGARVYASPELTLERAEDRVKLRGTLLIPRADIDLDRLPGAESVNASPDVVVVDAGSDPASGKGLPLDVDVTVTLGSGDREQLDDDVDLEGYGLDGNVTGRLRIRERPGRQPTGTGELQVTGKYKAYGQNLEIERGRLLFANSQLDNPGLDLRAVRRLRGVTPGLRITGTALRPVLVVYADPAMDQSDALSYLMTGRPLRSLKSGEGDALGAAARMLGTATGDLLAKGLGRRLGVDEIGVSDDANLGGAAFTVGKYLSPRLYLSYGVGVFDPGQIVTLRYALTKVWEIEASSGSVESRAGINYRIER